jgi:hypothetical protein
MEGRPPDTEGSCKYILKKQSRTADKEWSSSLGVGVGLKTHHLKNVTCYEMFQSAMDLGTDSLARPKQLKKDKGFGTWNVRSSCRVGAIKLAVGELEKYKT